MNKRQAKRLFEKYIKNECSPQEIELLNTYLDSFQDKTKLWAELKYDEEIKEKLWSKINSEINGDKKPNHFSFKKYVKYAAVFIGLAGGFLWYQFNNVEPLNTPEFVNDSAIILKTSGNKTIEINADQEQVVLDENGKIIGKQNGGQISYDANKDSKELEYNEIIVPNGKKFKLILSDGSLAHMNSGSSLKYPVNFISGMDRRVFLKGEAYFEVTKDTENPFLVSTEEMEIRVLGTHFNVSSYQGSDTYAVLAEGSVAVYDTKSTDMNATTIRPGEKAVIAHNAIEVTAVDIDDYLGWMDGLLYFNDEPFFNIVQKIERHYGVSIDNEFSKLDSDRFRGVFNEETITDLLDTFKESARFEYVINNNKIIIKPMKE